MSPWQTDVAVPLDWPSLLTAVVRHQALPSRATAWAMEQVMAGEASSAQIAALAVGLRSKGETADEVVGLVTTMLAHAERIEVAGLAVDTCGTGGDRSHTVNISTMSAMVVAGAGGRVVKHGNRAASSTCGSADLLEELGVVIDLGPSLVPECIEDAGIGFCFAPRFHPALRHAAVARRELGIATFFNFLGPLANPAQPAAQAVGVADARMAGVMADVLARRGASALLFRGDDGLDELTTTAPSHVWEVRGGEVTASVLDVADIGVGRATTSQLRGGDRAYNAAVTRRFLDGEAGPVRDAVLVNAAAGLVALDAAAPDFADGSPLPERLRAALARAAAAVDDGLAAAALDRWVETSQRLAAR